MTFLVTGLMGRFAYHGVGDHPWRWLWTQGDSGHWRWVKDDDILSDTDPVPVCWRHSVVITAHRMKRLARDPQAGDT